MPKLGVAARYFRETILHDAALTFRDHVNWEKTLAKRRQPPDEIDRLLKQTAETIGSTLGKLALKAGLAKPEPSAPKKTLRKKPSPRKAAAAKAVAVGDRHKLAKARAKRTPKKAPQGKKGT
jgi:hypothetical protein